MSIQTQNCSLQLSKELPQPFVVLAGLPNQKCASNREHLGISSYIFPGVGINLSGDHLDPRIQVCSKRPFRTG